VIPTYRACVTSAVPSGLTYWTPRPEDIGEENFGCFRDTWPLGRVSGSQARSVLETERSLVATADELAADELEYEQLAAAIEFDDFDALPSRWRQDPVVKELELSVVGQCVLGGLELGVAGLANALASVGGCFPAASCRAHQGRSWAPYPVVVFAADQFRTERLAPLVIEAGCGFAVDPARADLVGIGAACVTSLMSLAESVLTSRSAFRQPREGHRGRRAPHESQLRLDF